SLRSLGERTGDLSRCASFCVRDHLSWRNYVSAIYLTNFGNYSGTDESSLKDYRGQISSGEKDVSSARHQGLNLTTSCHGPFDVTPGFIARGLSCFDPGRTDQLAAVFSLMKSLGQWKRKTVAFSVNFFIINLVHKRGESLCQRTNPS